MAQFRLRVRFSQEETRVPIYPTSVSSFLSSFPSPSSARTCAAAAHRARSLLAHPAPRLRRAPHGRKSAPPRSCRELVMEIEEVL
ncbi:hypothetical protein BRADI_3g23346v3 [Brachypodium distachyon]|uniref:Uncharacterized protein n=1 Tax=Brachypodium distachyon TaxID=15368 RepID=A0A0Q3I7P4_BRADI|nr:hypothetical protein BRADI_3g23346v3 [Brachypodium distachyon]